MYISKWSVPVKNINNVYAEVRLRCLIGTVLACQFLGQFSLPRFQFISQLSFFGFGHDGSLDCEFDEDDLADWNVRLACRLHRRCHATHTQQRALPGESS